jgi:hypothetical protein
VVTAAVLGFLVGAFGVLGTGLVILVGPVLFGLAAGVEDSDAATAVAVGGGLTMVVGLLMLTWTVIMIWGAVAALRGRGRALLIIAGSISVALMLLSFASNVRDEVVDPGAVAFSLTFLFASLAIVVLLCLPPSSRFFAASRERRGG